MSGIKSSSIYDSLFADLSGMGFGADSIQHYFSVCVENKVDPIVSDAVDFLLDLTPISNQTTDNPLAPNIGKSEGISKLEEKIPTVIKGTSKSIAYPISSPLDMPTKHGKTTTFLARSDNLENVRDNFSKKLKLEKEQLEKYRRNILQRIDNDRKEANLFKQHPKSVSAPAKTKIQEDRDKNELFSRLSIRLLDGSIVVHYFNPMDTLDLVLTYLIENYELSNIRLIQSFPRIEYSPEEMKKFLLELGLGRSGSLIVKTIDDHSNLFGHSNSTDIDTQVPPQPVPQVLLPPGQNGHDWGVSGKYLGGDYIPKADFLNKIENTKPSKKSINFSVYITPLKELSFRILIQRCRANNFPSLSILSPLEGQMVLTRLIKEQLLSPKLVDKFMGCRMHTIDLTSCEHITNELLHRFNRFNSISTLIIKGSPYLTDKAITFIAKMSNLETLCLEDCENLTNNSCFSIAVLTKLNSLNLRGSKITDKGVFHLINSSALVYIEYLNLSNTQVTEYILVHLGKHCNFLKSLILKSTKVKFLPILHSSSNEFQLLRELDFSNCDFNNKTNFSDFFKVLNLDSLKLYAAEISDFTFLKFLRLKSITLPRHLSNSDGSSPIKYLVQYDLGQLDLSNSLSLSYLCMTYIGQMQTLSDLSLKNCRTCESSDFHSLCSLTQLKKLDLERTQIDDDASIYIFPHLTQLTYLNLSGTFISDRLLRSYLLNNCKNLTILNLNNTRISKHGLYCLNISYLQTLFLNDTLVDLGIKNHLYKRCVNLKLVTSNNLREIQTQSPDDQDFSSESD